MRPGFEEVGERVSVKAITAVWDYSEATGIDRLVLLAIADNADHDGGNSFPSLDEMARKTKVARSTVQLAIKRLVERGELVAESRGHETKTKKRSNLYTILLPTLGTRPEDPSTDSTGASTDATPGASTDQVGMEPSLNRPLEPSGPSRPDALVPAPGTIWPDTLLPIVALLRTFSGQNTSGCPLEQFDDPAYWLELVALTEGTDVYLTDELRQYVIWWPTKRGAKRHKDLRRGFRNWIKDEIEREKARRKREQERRGRRAG